MLAAYEQADGNTRAERAERAAWVAALGWPESGWGFFSGHSIGAAWDDLRRAFIDGSYLAAILVGQAFLENLLAGLLEWQKESPGRRAGLAQILKRTYDLGWLTDDEFARLDALRRLRNPYAHYRGLRRSESLTRRAMETGEAPLTLVERDA